MLFTWEILLHQILLVLLLVSSSIISILINQADLSGPKKITLFRFINGFNKAIVLPAALFLLIANVWGIAQTEYINVQNVSARFFMGLTGLITLGVSAFQITPLTNEGISELKRKSITGSKYQKIFQKLRTAFITIMLTVAASYWLAYLFR